MNIQEISRIVVSGNEAIVTVNDEDGEAIDVVIQPGWSLTERILDAYHEGVLICEVVGELSALETC